jgi:hypothetical protein
MAAGAISPLVTCVLAATYCPAIALANRHCISYTSTWANVMKAERNAWLNRLAGSQPFFSIADERQSRPTWSLGGLAAGAVPALVRSSHGYKPQLPADAREEPGAARPGDFFRN